MTTEAAEVTPSQLSPVKARALLNEFLQDRKHDARYASFDYCYGYFQSFRRRGRIGEIAEGENLRRSCIELGFYLASWGMMRGSSDLLNKSIFFLKPLVQVLAKAPTEIWALDVDRYGERPWEDLFKQESKRIVAALGPLRNGGSQILVTKIMLGVYGNVPAFDKYFTAGLGVTAFGAKALNRVGAYYQANQEWLSSFRVAVLGFDGSESDLFYPKAKLIDMIYFMKGLNVSRASSKEIAPQNKALA